MLFSKQTFANSVIAWLNLEFLFCTRFHRLSKTLVTVFVPNYLWCIAGVVRIVSSHYSTIATNNFVPV